MEVRVYHRNTGDFLTPKTNGSFVRDKRNGIPNWMKELLPSTHSSPLVISIMIMFVVSCEHQ